MRFLAIMPVNKAQQIGKALIGECHPRKAGSEDADL